mgnify:CR=1 FL=1
MSLSYEEVAQIIKMIDNSNCDEVNIEIDGIKILVRKNASNNAILKYVKAFLELLWGLFCLLFAFLKRSRFGDI